MIMADEANGHRIAQAARKQRLAKSRFMSLLSAFYVHDEAFGDNTTGKQSFNVANTLSRLH